MSSSLLQIPAGAFGLIGPKLVLPLLCLFSIIVSGRKCFVRTKENQKKYILCDSRIALGKSATLPDSVATLSSSEDRVLLIRFSVRLARHSYTCSSCAAMEWDGG
ncbi:hypothetical protein XENOCAPTIV_003095 [Xenoophorus captivus]|uniref:Secreted protein n=1 Tax=Xenoophorus captivus TaxID=1517983 RepID=A0ABV0QZ26_9TELE